MYTWMKLALANLHVTYQKQYCARWNSVSDSNDDVIAATPPAPMSRKSQSLTELPVVSFPVRSTLPQIAEDTAMDTISI